MARVTDLFFGENRFSFRLKSLSRLGYMPFMYWHPVKTALSLKSC